VLLKVAPILQDLAPQRRPTSSSTTETLDGIVKLTLFYEQRITQAGTRTAKDAMKVVEKEIEVDGLQGLKEMRETEPP
jgi:hypothetical protein